MGDRFERILIYWVVPGFLGLLGIMLVGLIAMLVSIAIWGDPAKEAFMASCVADRGAAKEYECQAMWRSGDRSVAPMPIIMPVPVR